MELDHIKYLKQAIEVSRTSREHGNTPFGAILVGPDGDVLLKQENIEISTHKCTGHAETALAEAASQKYPKDFLWRCTLYTSAEPCAMCTGAIYWANIGRIVYAMTEKRLLELTGNNDQNPTFNMPCRTILKTGQKPIEVVGPFEELEVEAAEVHKGYWK